VFPTGASMRPAVEVDDIDTPNIGFAFGSAVVDVESIGAAGDSFGVGDGVATRGVGVGRGFVRGGSGIGGGGVGSGGGGSGAGGGGASTTRISTRAGRSWRGRGGSSSRARASTT